MLKDKSKVLLVSLLIIIGLGGFSICCKSFIARSPLSEDKSIPTSCRMILEWLNQSQKSTENQSTITAGIGSVCKADLALESCTKVTEKAKQEAIESKRALTTVELNLVQERCLKFYVN